VATKSILKDVEINEKKLAEGLLSALENAANKSSIEVKFQRPLREVKGEDIKRSFGVE